MARHAPSRLTWERPAGLPTRLEGASVAGDGALCCAVTPVAAESGMAVSPAAPTRQENTTSSRIPTIENEGRIQVLPNDAVLQTGRTLIPLSALLEYRFSVLSPRFDSPGRRDGMRLGR